MHKYFFPFIILCLFQGRLHAQDTFSIVALDSASRQVGAAGASCLDLDFAGIADPAFLSDLLPDTGAVNTQSYFIQANQDNARARMRAGDSPAQIISWLVANDAINNPEFKQYGIVGFQGLQASSASHSGNTCIDYKNHVNGSIQGMYYAIQGNILKGQEILDSMEARFRNTPGNLACRIMAAMQGANVPGADTRCLNNNTSSLFAFLQVANPGDSYGQPSLKLTVKTSAGSGVEPIDSLQQLFNAVQPCAPSSLVDHSSVLSSVMFPNPVQDYIFIKSLNLSLDHLACSCYDQYGRLIFQQPIHQSLQQIPFAHHPSGIYLLVFTQHGVLIRKEYFMKVD